MWWFQRSPRKRTPAKLVVSPSSDLWDLVVDLDWPRVIEHATEFPHDAEWTDGHWHETPLYSACQNNPPLEVIQALVRAYPNALMCPTRGNHDLPIHIACRYQLSGPILEELLRRYPETALEQTRWGRTPIMALWEFRQKSGDHDEDYLDDELWKKVIVLLKAVARFRQLARCPYESPNRRKNRFRCMNSDTEQYNTDSSEDTSELEIVHAAVSLGSLSCPALILERSLSNFPEQVFRRDQSELLPLHVAVGPSTWNASTRRQYKPREHDFIQLLLGAYPEAAREPNHHDNHRCPLHSAVCNRHTWDGGVECLFRAAPEVVLKLDPVTKLYPFQLAAIPIRDNKVDLDTIYMLLRSHPDVLTLMDCLHTNRVNDSSHFIQKTRRSMCPFLCYRPFGMDNLLLGILTAISIGSLSGMIFGGS